MATAVFEEGKDYVNEENEPELSKQKDYEAVFDTFDEEDRPPLYQAHESDPLSDFEHNVISDEDTESLTGSLDGVTGGDELTGDDTEYHSDPITKQTRQEKLQMLALRRHLDLLSEQVLQNDYLVNQSREELMKCQDNIQSLENEIEEIEKEIELQESKENKASLYRLKSQYTKLCNELKTEREVETAIRERLVSAEYSLSLATMEQGRFLLAGEELAKEEEIEIKSKAEASAGRIRKENITALAAEKRRRIREKDHITALRERERKHRHAINMAKRSREQASKFLKETMTRVRLKEAEEEEFHRADMENRIKNLLSLKSNIENNKESLRSMEARRAYLRSEEEEKERQEREEILKEGLNPDEVLTKRKRLRQFEKDKETFEKRQRERQIEIADKLLREEKQMKKRYQQQPQLWPDKQRDRNKRFGRRKTKSKSLRVYSGSSSMEYSADAEDAGGAFVPSKLIPFSSDDEDEFSPFGHTSRDEEKEGDSDHEGDDLAEPEFRGLWEENKENENKNLSKTETKLKFTDHIPSKTEQDMMERALVKQKENIVQKQVAVGREFKGQAFNCKPEVVIFKDFDIGKSYRKKVILTNVSYTQNFCKYVGMSSQLLDFIDIIFDPPGVMSAGLTCDFTVMFKPMLNEDLIGQIDFLAQTGPFSVPIKCFTKKCQVSVDKNEMNYGSQVLGETCQKTIMLINDGALATKFNIKKYQNEKPDDDIVSLPNSEVGSNIAETVPVESKQDKEQLRTTTDKVLQSHVNSTLTQGETNTISKEQETDQQETPDCKHGFENQTTDKDVFIVGKVSCGDLSPFSSVQLEIIFAPIKPGDSSCMFEITFEDTDTSPIMITARGTGVDVPVWVDREVVDLKICMFDRLYQDAIVVNNRATSALRLKFEVCKELKNHLELLPKTAYIQAQSQFSAQLKFLPRKTLYEDCPECFNNETGVLEAPLIIKVADQTRPVQFMMRTIVTASDIEFSVSEVDLGYCTIVESVRQTITMTNKSILAQMYGFCGVPECFEIQPNDGFGTLLPLETLNIDVIFSAKKAQEYKVDLVCKNGIGTEYRLSCKGIGVYPPLELSQSTVSFRATAIDDISIASLKMINSHSDGNEFTHEVPRIGRGPVVPVGPTTFEFVIPPGAPVNISPAVGVVLPNQSCNIEVTFSPKLADSDILQEACRIAEKIAEMKRKLSEENASKEKSEDIIAPQGGKKQLNKVGKKSGKGSPKRGQTPASTPGIRNQTTPNKTSPTKDFKEGSDEYCAAKLSLLKQFENQLSSYAIPCFIASGESNEPGTLPYSTHNTLYLKVHCPAVKPQLVIVSNCGRSVVDFGQVSVGQRLVKDILIQNISSSSVELSSSILDPHGPFLLLNANKILESMETQSCVISFSPQLSQEFYEVLDLNSSRSSLHIRLKGKGVKPVVSSSVQNGLIDFGYSLVRDSSTLTFKLENNSGLRVTFNLELASMSKPRRSKLRNIIPLGDDRSVIGCSNYHGQVVFDCVPSCGSIEAGKSQDIAVTFTADHSSDYYADELSIEVNNDVSETVSLRARASSTLMYLQGWDEKEANEESLSEIITEHEEGVPIQKVVLLLFKSRLNHGQSYSAVERRVEVGCIKSTLQTRKSCEFVFDNPKECNEKGFSFDPIKSSVEAGNKKDIICRWQPTADHDPSTVVTCSTTITVKGEMVTQYKVLLRGFIVSED